MYRLATIHNAANRAIGKGRICYSIGGPKTDQYVEKKKTRLVNREIGEAPILKDEVEKAIRMLKKDKSPGVENIPAEILKYGGP